MERKLLTVLLDFLDHVLACIQAHGGMVGRYAGDAFMAAFGIPQAHEDDAIRAVCAGLSLLRMSSSVPSS